MNKRKFTKVMNSIRTQNKDVHFNGYICNQLKYGFCRNAYFDYLELTNDAVDCRFNGQFGCAFNEKNQLVRGIMFDLFEQYVLKEKLYLDYEVNNGWKNKRNLRKG